MTEDGLVGWAKARSSRDVPTIKKWWARLRFAHPTRPSLAEEPIPLPHPACSHTARRSTGSPP
ncbi:hypothetical protein D6B98_08295 [Bradyrhizobium sp. LVM 105]|nr:hypothetical protein D6B98_08295 [Bradyrhizobium sp. LVM 105]